MAKRRIVRVTYLDHVRVAGESSLDKIERTKPFKCIIYGELLVETEGHVTILSYYEKPQEDATLEFYAMTILRSTILEMQELGELKKE